MATERVEFFDQTDLFCGLGLEKVETMSIPKYETININDAIEFFQIHKYFEAKIYLKKWNCESIELYSKKEKELFGLACRYFSNLCDNNIVVEFNNVEECYYSAFWDLFIVVGLHNTISENAFEKLINNDHVFIYDILERKKLVKKYGQSLRRFLLKNEHCTEVLVCYYEQDPTEHNHNRIYLPSELTGKDVVDCLNSFLDMDYANANIVSAIFFMRKTDRFPISDELRLKAKRRYAKEIDRLAAKKNSIESKISVSILDNQDKESVICLDGLNATISYDKKWLLETLDYPSVLNNFIYIFEFADYQQMRCNLVSLESKCGTIEKAFRPKSPRFYPDYTSFQHRDAVSLLQMQIYCDFLNENEISLEKVIHWFFTEYLADEFGCTKMRVSLPSAQTSFLEKCIIICSAMEAVVKQFALYAEKKTIDFELISLSSGSPKYREIPSLVDKKYIYGIGNIFRSLSFLLFSDQSPLAHNKRLRETKKIDASCFFDLLISEQVNRDDYIQFYQSNFDYLQKHELITISNEGVITIGNKAKLLILKDLYYHEAISRWHWPNDLQPIFQEWIEQGILCEKSSLLTKPESNYFNFILNNSEYCNGYALRNRYSHGTEQIVSDENEHQKNYYMLLRLMVILTIKINDDFCLYKAQQTSITESNPS